MRPSLQLFIGLLAVAALSLFFYPGMGRKRQDNLDHLAGLRPLVTQLGITDLCLSTEARYTRHPVASDSMAVVMDHPGAVDHFPSSLFWAPVP